LLILIASVSLAVGAYFEKFGWTLTVLVGSVVMYFALRNIRLGWSSSRWPTAVGKVTESRAVEFRDQDGSSLEGKIRYGYKVNGFSYVSGRVRYSFNSAWDCDGALTSYFDTQRYKSGDDVVVHYHPNCPTVAVLRPGISIVPVLVLAAVLSMEWLIFEEPLVLLVTVALPIAANLAATLRSQ